MTEAGLDGSDRADPELALRELDRAAHDIARERLEVERALGLERAMLAAAQAEVRSAERTAKTHRQAQLDAVRGRADLERRLQGLIEAETLARTRGQQAQQRAQGFRAGATFAASGRAEADGASDPNRLERERLVEARALREAEAAESRAAEERVEEQKIGTLRAELEMHVGAEREVEAAVALERDEAERQASYLRETIERLGLEIAEAESALQRLAEEAEPLAHERAVLAERCDAERRATRRSLETRIAALHTIEDEATRERHELEAMLAEITTREGAQLAAFIEEAAAAAAFAADEEAADAAAAAADAFAAQTPAQTAPASEPAKVAPPPLYVAKPAPAKATAKPTPAAKPAPTESFIRPAAQTYRPANAASRGADEEELIPGLRSFVGNFFAKKKAAAPPKETQVEENSTVADRIARDFGLLGGDPK